MESRFRSGIRDMLETARSRRGMVTAPHRLAADAGLDVLKAGGTALEAAVATAAALAVLYPHMTGIGGDAFWLVAEPGRPPVAIDACGRAAAAADLDFYRDAGVARIPERGPLAINTVAGAVSSWAAALSLSGRVAKPLGLPKLLEAAVHYAESGIVVTRSQSAATAARAEILYAQPGFAEVFMPEDEVPAEGALLKQPALAESLTQLAEAGLEDFYFGDLAAMIGDDLERLGTPLSRADLANHRAAITDALSCRVSGATLFNTAPPTQGVSSLMILALFDRLKVQQGESFAHVHGLVEATKQAFMVRDRYVGDPARMPIEAEELVSDGILDALAARISPDTALPWPHAGQPGDTVWLGVINSAGRAVSMIQSIYYDFGSGVVLPQSGILWQNRGASFRLASGGWNALLPGRKPFHTLNPAMALFDDGRHMVYGTMGGDGQPQTQAAIFSRYGFYGMPLQQAVTAPRWLLGRTWGEGTVGLKLEDRFHPDLVEALAEAGHNVEIVAPFTELMGHAGALVRHPDGGLEGAGDPRSDGSVAAW